LVSIIVVCGIDMFDRIAKQLEVQTLGKGQKDFSISEGEFEDFCKGFLFEELKGNDKLGEAFCKKYNESNYVLSILPNDSAKQHIRKFYVK
jgi:hypothetical protein